MNTPPLLPSAYCQMNVLMNRCADVLMTPLP